MLRKKSNDLRLYKHHWEFVNISFEFFQEYFFVKIFQNIKYQTHIIVLSD